MRRLLLLLLAPLLCTTPDAPVCPTQRALRLRIDVPATPAEVFSAWTSEEGATTFFAPAARIDPRPLGAYELLFAPDAPPGQRGAEENLLLALQAPELVAFTWDAPPHLPDVRRQRTSVTLRLEPLEAGGTRLWFEQTGWGRGGQWDEAFRYFEAAWPKVLARLRRRFAEAPLDWKALPAEEPGLAHVEPW
jgi:uncharacterized protein YndB with AHSA1/START domain